jgi:hypothetical protein
VEDTRPRIDVDIIDDFYNHPAFCRQSLTVRDKRGVTLPLELQPAQLKLHRLIEKLRAARRPVRIIALKARQVMVSTAVAAEFFHLIPFHDGQRGLIVAHEEKASKNIYGYYRQFHDNYKPYGVRPPFEPGVALTDVDTEAHAGGTIAYKNGSKIEISTANNVKTGRSSSIRYLHLSEYAFWRDAATLMTGLMQVVPDDPDTMVVIESTANGVGGDFHKRWTEASAPGYSGEWACFFFAWWEHPEYSRAISDHLGFVKSCSREELHLKETYNLTWEQLHWRRWAIANKCDGSVDQFAQEYPANDAEAFLASGRPRFDLKALARMPRIEDGLEGELEEIQVTTKKTLQFHAQARGAMRLYRRPVPNKAYTIGVDVATGIDPSAEAGGSSDPDYSVATVHDRDTWEQVAKIRVRLEPDPFAEYVDALARFYNWSFIVPEANGPGIAFIGSLLRLGYPPSLIYHRRPDPSEQFRPDQSTLLQTLGWQTNTSSRIILISRLDRAIRDGSLLLHDPHTIREHETFVIKANGKAEASDGMHDDEVIAAALAVVGLETPPPDPRLLGVQRPAPPGSMASGTVTRYGRGRDVEIQRVRI